MEQDTTDKETILIVGDGNVVGNHSSSQVTKAASQPAPPSSSPLRPANSRGKRPLWIVAASGVASVILALTTNIVAVYLQEKFGILSDTDRFAAVVVVFLVSLVIVIWLGIRYGQPPH